MFVQNHRAPKDFLSRRTKVAGPDSGQANAMLAKFCDRHATKRNRDAVRRRSGTEDDRLAETPITSLTLAHVTFEVAIGRHNLAQESI